VGVKGFGGEGVGDEGVGPEGGLDLSAESDRNSQYSK
jgi:hypothetical protein